MKKRRFNVIDVLIIIIIVMCAVGITVRAFSLKDVKTEAFADCRVSFTAKLDEDQLGAINPGIVLTDEKGTEFKILEGYWITSGEKDNTLNGELLVPGRITDKGFECEGGYYYKDDVIRLNGSGLTFEATLYDFIKQ